MEFIRNLRITLFGSGPVSGDDQIEIGLQAYQIERGVIGGVIANQCNTMAPCGGICQQVSFTRFCPRNYKPTFRGLNLQVHRTEYGEAFTAAGERCAIKARK